MTPDERDWIARRAGSMLAAPWVPRGVVVDTGAVTNGSPPTNASTVTYVAVTGLDDVSLTAVTGRRYRLVAVPAYSNSSVAGGVSFSFRDGGASAPSAGSTALDASFRKPGAGTAGSLLHAHIELSVTGLSAGVHRIGLFFRAMNTGTATALDGTVQSWLRIYDDGLG